MEATKELGDEGAHAGRLFEDVQRLWTDMEGTGGWVGAMIRDRVEQSPLGTLAAAGFAGYVLGGGLAAPLTRLMFRAGARVLLASMIKSQLAAEGPHPAATTTLQH